MRKNTRISKNAERKRATEREREKHYGFYLTTINL